MSKAWPNQRTEGVTQTDGRTTNTGHPNIKFKDGVKWYSRYLAKTVFNVCVTVTLTFDLLLSKTQEVIYSTRASI